MAVYYLLCHRYSHCGADCIHPIRSEWRKVASEGRASIYERETIEADRGDILACDGRILATSVPTYEVRMDFAAQGLADSIFRRHVDALADSLSNFFGDKNKNAYLIMLNRAYSNKKRNRYLQIAPRRVNHLEIKRIAQFPILKLGPNRGGFIAVQINKRLLPNGALASRTIGRVMRLAVNGESKGLSTVSSRVRMVIS